MKCSRLLGLSAVAMMLAAPAAVSTAAGPVQYQISMEMHDGDRLVGSPRLTFAAGASSKIEIGDAAGNRYSMDFTVTPQTADTVAIRSNIEVVSGGQQQKASPNMVVALNTRSAFAFGAESAASKPFRVDFTIDKAG